ncbi:30S ribosome-binding factor RbfA [Geothrix edaphica]|uniref:Ribosome-binding factor A n=1 Tax=Geothrix edaphica TaxID=2927976 RepID=A0ABQ5PW97_9BACT|nr:30S ribosome-binding factor RbfA [Geothrix edaphica]GLH66374.1 ribosome-binding factor A [Geothrix edaphica]
MQRPERLEDQVHFLLSTLVQRELRDPELGFVTLTAVRLSPDRSVAKVYFTVLPANGGDQEAQDLLTRKALGRAAGFLRSQLANRLKMRRVPELRFFPDGTLEDGNHMETLLAEIEKERAARPADPASEEG